MIKRPLVLILGAGASIPFGFPSGRQLLIRICKRLGESSTKFSRLLTQIGFKYESIHSFTEQLLNSMLPSVDTFLEKRPEFLEVGKAAIAAALIPYENRDQLKRNPERIHWYEYLFGKLAAAGLEDFKDNKISFITYNYDRSLEYFLLTAIQNSFGLSYEQAMETVVNFPLIHVHGKLGHLPKFQHNALEYGFCHGRELNPDVIKSSMSEIKIISELESTTPEFEKAHELLNQSNKICFLGFGYNPTNIKRLMQNFKENRFVSERIIGSAYGIEIGERPEIENTFKKYNKTKIHLGDQTQDVLAFLRSKNFFE
jgi:hypothetical protein